MKRHKHNKYVSVLVLPEYISVKVIQDAQDKVDLLYTTASANRKLRLIANELNSMGIPCRIENRELENNFRCPHCGSKQR